MPYLPVWHDPDIVVTHRGVTVYHLYREDRYDYGPHDYHVTSDPSVDTVAAIDHHPAIHDVRTLAPQVGVDLTRVTRLTPPELLADPAGWWATIEENRRLRLEAVADVLRRAIDAGIVTTPTTPDDTDDDGFDSDTDDDGFDSDTDTDDGFDSDTDDDGFDDDGFDGPSIIGEFFAVLLDDTGGACHPAGTDGTVLATDRHRSPSPEEAA